MNKTMQQPNGPGPTMVEQAAFVNGRGTRLIGAPDSGFMFQADNFAALRRYERSLAHEERVLKDCKRLGKVIGTAAR